MRRSIPLNMISLECGSLNDKLIEIIDNLRAIIINHFTSENHYINRG